MSSIVTIVLTALLSISADNLEQCLKELDITIESQSLYEKERLDCIRVIHENYSDTLSYSRRYDSFQELYRQYDSYNVDSAVFYVSEKLRMAEKMGDRYRIVASQLDLAKVYIYANMLAEAENIIEHYTPEARRLFPTFYLHIRHSLALSMRQNASSDSLRESYDREVGIWRDALMEALEPGSMDRVYLEAEKYIDMGEYDSAVEVIINHYAASNDNIRNRAVLAYMLAQAMSGKGDVEAAKYYYAQSAIADLRSSVKEYKALQELAVLLYHDDVKRAYDYIMCSMDDMLESNSRIHSKDISSMLTVIIQERDDLARMQTWKINMALILVILLLGAAVVLLLIVVKRSNELVTANARLKEATAQLMESNCIKDEYLLNYMELSLDYIEKLGKYRRSLLKIARTRSADDVIKEIEAPVQTESIFKEFYNDFDNAFLHICPTFVRDVNALLDKDKQLIPKPHVLLNTELRVLALIRLGITDSVKISHFLRVSLSTVYNYRTKLRNAAVGPRDEFEDKVAKIGLNILS